MGLPAERKRPGAIAVRMRFTAHQRHPSQKSIAGLWAPGRHACSNHKDTACIFECRHRRESSRTAPRLAFRTCLTTVLCALATQIAAAPADYPTKAVTIVVPAPPGGIIDASARWIGMPLSRALSQPFVVENKGGGSGNVAYAQVARSAAEGYTLLASYSGYHVGNPLLTPKLPWAPKDLEPSPSSLCWRPSCVSGRRTAARWSVVMTPAFRAPTSMYSKNGWL